MDMGTDMGPDMQHRYGSPCHFKYLSVQLSATTVSELELALVEGPYFLHA